MKKINIGIFTFIILLTSCQFQPHKGKPNSIIDNTLQAKATSILENKLSVLNT